ncbi:MAG: hypothetical protein Q4G26_07225 [Paracoccus sp. (in: a-proteobacteria)]|nr:hypothetical protein [Paracoccus sp. (in: a-proteobacteria)]
MKRVTPAPGRETYAAEYGGAVFKSAGSAQPEWDDILAEDEEILWQGPSQPRLVMKKGWRTRLAVGIILGVAALVVIVLGPIASKVFGLLLLAIAVRTGLSPEFVHYHHQRRVFYSLSNKRAFKAWTDWRGRRRLAFWPITPESSFRRISGDPPSIRFYHSRKERGMRRPDYHSQFEAIPDASRIYQLLKRIRKNAA